MNRLKYRWIAGWLCTLAWPSPTIASEADPPNLPEKPNVVVIFCDDLGWGDLGCYGHPTIATPNLNAMARQGTRMTQFYVAASVCTPSRAALLTGRYPVRTGLCGESRVFFPNATGGMPASELTVAEVVKQAGYATAMAGKWHLGDADEYLPTQHGFDSYFGIPYSNDMEKRMSPSMRGMIGFRNPKWRHFHVPLLQSTTGHPPEQLERPVDQRTITRRYTHKAIDFIRQQKDSPFFLYLAHTMPHVPLFRHDAFADHSRAGLYGDVIEEIDWSVGEILRELRRLELDEKTLVLFTSDNGPWLVFQEQSGSAGPLRDGTGTRFEGGMRGPAIFWMPGVIPAGVVSAQLSSTLDLLPTVAKLSNVALPEDLVLDGHDLTAMLTQQRPSPRETLFYYRDTRLMAIRHGRYKAHYITQLSYRKNELLTDHDPPLIYDLEIDLAEGRDLASKRPDLVEQFAEIKAEHQRTMVIAKSLVDLDRK
ncbi:MAG: sulfatase [Planctomycetota bacterium]